MSKLLRPKLSYILPAILTFTGVVFFARGWILYENMAELVAGRKSSDAEIINRMMVMTSSPGVTDRRNQLIVMDGLLRHTHRSTRVIISDKPGSYLVDNSSTLDSKVVPNDVVEIVFNQWRNKDHRLFADGINFRHKGHEFNAIGRELYQNVEQGIEKRFTILITNLDRSIEKHYPSSALSLLLSGILIGCGVILAIVPLILPLQRMQRAIAQSQKVKIDSWWPVELASLAGQYNRFLAEQEAASGQLMESIEQLAAANKEIEMISSAMRHDIKSSIGGINNAFQQIESMGYEPPEEILMLFNLAKSRASLAARLVANTGRLEIELKIAEVTLGEIFNDLKTMFVGYNVTYDTEYNSVKISIDKDVFILKVLGNLINNAIKYSPLGNEEVSVLVKDKGDSILLIVKDKGFGLTEDEQVKVLSSYGQSARLNPNIEGTGTGLHTVQKVLKLHDLKLEVKSSKGSGSLFYIQIPKT